MKHIRRDAPDPEPLRPWSIKGKVFVVIGYHGVDECGECGVYRVCKGTVSHNAFVGHRDLFFSWLLPRVGKEAEIIGTYFDSCWAGANKVTPGNDDSWFVAGKTGLLAEWSWSSDRKKKYRFAGPVKDPPIAGCWHDVGIRLGLDIS